MLKNKFLLSILIVIAAIVLIFTFAFFSRSYWQKAKNQNGDIDTTNTVFVNTSDQNAEAFEASRMFRLVRGQSAQADELDLRLIVLDYIFVPCQENASCRYRQFRVEIAASSISDPSKSERVLFGNFPAQTYALGKIFQIVNAEEESFQLFVRQADDSENAEAEKEAGAEIKFEIDAGEDFSTNAQ